MNDPHVELLRYRFVSENPNDRFDSAKPLILSLGPFDIELNEGILEVHPQKHYPDIERAKQEFEPFLYEFGYIERTPSRSISDKGKQLLKELK